MTERVSKDPKLPARQGPASKGPGHQFLYVARLYGERGSKDLNCLPRSAAQTSKGPGHQFSLRSPALWREGPERPELPDQSRQ